MRKVAFLASVLGLSMFAACSGGGSSEQKEEAVVTETEATTTEVAKEEAPASDDFMADKGIGPVTSVDLGATIDEEMAKKGEQL